MTCKKFWNVFSGKAALAAVLSFFCVAFSAPAFAQTAEIRSTGVYYIDGASNIDNVYCNWDNIPSTGAAGAAANKSAIVNVGDHHTNDPWDTSALIEYDQPYPSPTEANNYPNHCLALCMDVYCTNKPNGATTYSISFPIQNIMFEIVKYRNGADISNAEANPAIRTIFQSILENGIVEGTGSGQTIDAGNLSDYMCAGYSCMGANSDFSKTCTCPNPEYECRQRKDCNNNDTSCYECRPLNKPGDVWENATNVCLGLYKEEGWDHAKLYCGNGKDESSFGGETNCIVSATTGKGYNDTIRICTA